MRLVRSFFSMLVLIVMLALVAGCSSDGFGATSILPTMDVNVQVSPLQFTATNGAEGGVSFESSDISITVNAKAGSVGGYISSYSIAYSFADGSAVSAGSSTVRSGGLGLRIEPGVSCASSGGAEGETTSTTKCDVITSKANFAPGPAATATGVQGVPAELAYYYWCNYRVDVGAKALLTLSGVSDLGQTYTWRGEIAVDSNGDFLPANLSKPSICEGA